MALARERGSERRAMTWVTIAETDLDAHLAAIQVDAIKNYLRTTQTDPFTDAMTAVVSRIRNNIAAKGKVLSGTALSVPPEAKDYACWLIIESLQVRISGLKIEEDQKNMIREAKEYIKLLGQGDHAVSSPDDPIAPTVTIGLGATVVTSTPKNFTREKMDGL